MKIDAVAVSTTNMKKTVAFYSLLGFDFSTVDISSNHVEPTIPDGSVRLMIDTIDIIQDIIGETPKSSNHSSFAIRFDSVKEVDDIVIKLEKQNFTIIKQPWDAFWNQRYAVIEDPDGYRIDLFADLQSYL